jgi:anti-anti-sigma factor
MLPVPEGGYPVEPSGMPSAVAGAAVRVNASGRAGGAESPVQPCPARARFSAVEETVNDIPKADRPDRFSVEHSQVDGVRVVTVRGEIDHDVTDAFGQALQAGRETGRPHVVADLSGVTFMDSSGINVLVAAHQQLTDAGGWLRIAAAQEPVLRILRIVGLDAVIPCHPTVEQALTD